jgi:hypothetical protein
MEVTGQALLLQLRQNFPFSGGWNGETEADHPWAGNQEKSLNSTAFGLDFIYFSITLSLLHALDLP